MRVILIIFRRTGHRGSWPKRNNEVLPYVSALEVAAPTSVLLVLANAASPALAQIRRNHHGRRAGPRTHRRHRPAHRRRPRRRLGRVPRLGPAGQALVQGRGCAGPGLNIVEEEGRRREPRAAPGAGPEHRRGGGLRHPPQHRHPRLGHGPQHQDRGHGRRGADRAGPVRRPGRVLLPAHPAHVGRRGQQGAGGDQVRSADRRRRRQHALGADPGRDRPRRRQARPARRQLRYVPRPRPDRRLHRDGARLRRGAQPRDAAGEQLGLQGARLGRRHGLQDPGLRGQGRAAAGRRLGRRAVARAEAAVLGRGVGRDLRRPDARRLPRRSAAALPGQPARRAERRALDLPGDAPDRLHRPARPDDDRVPHEDRAGLVQAERRPQRGEYGLHEPERDPRGPRDLRDRVRGHRRRARHVERGGRAAGAQQQSRVLRDRRADGARLLVRGLGRRAPARGLGALPRGRGGPLPERRPLPDGRRPDAADLGRRAGLAGQPDRRGRGLGALRPRHDHLGPVHGHAGPALRVDRPDADPLRVDRPGPRRPADRGAQQRGRRAARRRHAPTS